MTNILLFLVICLNEILFTGCTVFLRLNYTTIVQLLYSLNVLKCAGLQPYLTRLTGLPVDEIIQLFGWMVAINPLGQAGSSLQPIRIILEFVSPSQNHSWIWLTQSESFLNLAHPIRIILEFGSTDQSYSWIWLTQSESFLNLTHPIRIILEFGSPNHATGKFVPAIRATTTNRDKVGLLFNCLELYGCNPHVHTLLRSRENIGACFTCKNFTMGLTVGWLLSPSSLCFPQYLAG